MPRIPIVMPQLGESIAEATIIRFNVAVGDTVEVDQEVIEVETSKAAMGITTLCGGVVKEILAEEGVSYAVGSVLGTVEATAEEIERTGVSTVSEGVTDAVDNQGRESEEEANLHFKTEDGGYFEPKDVSPTVQGLPVPAGKKGAHYISPRMRARMDELGLRAADISAIAGSGGGGRVTVEDLEGFLEYISEWPASPASPMRLAVADAMRRSWSRPLASVGHPVIMDKLLDHRRAQNPKPGLTLYVLRAFALALAEFPSAAGFLIGEKIVHPKSFDIGCAVQVEDGVMVPVIRQVDTKSVSALSAEYAELVE
ncbi:MAG: pyruvate/2-oxoglutarate dehydrogenase complex dihydrolipoamide acyltransferase (E2) component, partial [Cryomorphaceae bacterium]